MATRPFYQSLVQSATAALRTTATSAKIAVMSSRVAIFFTTLAVLSVVSFAVFFLASGYTLNRQSGRIEKTGMVVVKSDPDVAKIYVDGALISATNATVANLKPGAHKIRLDKEGFAVWQKEILVKEELVTEVNAVLVPLTPKLLPLTVNGVSAPALSRDGERIAFFSSNVQTPGIWFLPLAGRTLLNLSQSSPKLLIADSGQKSFSAGTDIQWSPDDSEILAQLNRQGYYLISVSQIPSSSFTATSSAEPALARWRETELTSRQGLLDKIAVAPEIAQSAVEAKTLWAQNGKRFLYQKEGSNKIEYHVYDLASPLPVGGQNDYLSLTVDRASNLKVSWYSDSNHLLLFSCQKFAETPSVTPAPANSRTTSTTNVSNSVTSSGVGCREGAVELIEIDGTNRTLVYKGAVYSDQVFPSPDGSQLIILTSFNPDSEPNLYAISLR